MRNTLLVSTSFLLILSGCQPATRRQPERTRDEAKEAAQTAQREIEAARISIAQRLDRLDQEIQQLDAKVAKSSGKAKVKLEQQSQELQADARNFREKMSTWDDKVESVWRISKREIEEGLTKAEDSIRKLLGEKQDKGD
jgi:TolA-binding protein